MESPGVGRGVAAGDYDADGDIDLLIVNAGEKPMLLRNDGGNSQNWLYIRTVGVESNRDGIGARIKVITGDIHQIREVSAGSSYLSQNSPEVEFGLGKHDKVDKVIIQWSSGTLQTIKANQRLIVSEKAE